MPVSERISEEDSSLRENILVLLKERFLFSYSAGRRRLILPISVLLRTMRRYYQRLFSARRLRFGQLPP